MTPLRGVSRRARPGIGAVAVLIAGTLWGTTGTAAAQLVGGATPIAAGAAAFVIGGALLFLVSARGSARVIQTSARPAELLLGSLAVAAFPLGFYASLQFAGVAVGTVVTVGSAPLFAAALETLQKRRPPRATWYVAAACALVGLVLLVMLGDPSEANGSDLPLGVAAGLIGGASYAYYTIASARLIADGHSTRNVMGALFGLGAVPLLPVAAFTMSGLLVAPVNAAVLGYLALGPMFVAYLFFGAGLAGVSGSTATLITLVEPVVAALLAVTIVGERVNLTGWIGIALILVAVLVAAVGSAARQRPDNSRMPTSRN